MRFLNIKFIIAFLLLCFCINALAFNDIQLNHPSERFTRYLDAIDPYIVHINDLKDFEDKVEYSNNESFRSNLTGLQNVIRVYKSHKDFKALAPFYEMVKEFEDHISHHRDIGSNLNSAKGHGSEKAIQHFQKIYDDEIESYKKFFSESNWFLKQNGLSEQLRQILKNLKWRSIEDDRDLLLGRLARFYRKRIKETYDFSQVEYGMHEFRRDVRRLSYFDDALDGIIDFEYDLKCPLGQPVAKVPERSLVTTYRCKISACLQDALNDVNSEMSNMRSEGSNYEHRGEPVSQELVDRGNKVYNNFIEQKVYLHLASQLEACRAPKKDKESKKEKANELFNMKNRIGVWPPQD